ncbi:MAG: Hsp20/alpha crystallin family protein [Deltaproteobacteria bacterium]|nr:Hsp20/alpha crystallin family protein [Deltaproteobacteria bacterium]
MTKEEKKEIEVREKEQVAPTEGEPTREGVYYTPSVDIYADDEAITVTADLPGVKTEDLEVDLREGVLTVTGHVGPAESRLKPVYREYGIGGYTRRFTVGDKIDQAAISAKLEHGVLELRLPRAERHKPRKIEVKAA